MPVVTTTTFQDGVSGVASRSRLTTPYFSGSPRMLLGDGRIPRVLPVPVPATMPKGPAAGPVPENMAMLPLQQGVDVGTEGELDGLAGGPGRGDDDDPALGVPRRPECLRVEREVMVAARSLAGKASPKQRLQIAVFSRERIATFCFL